MTSISQVWEKSLVKSNEWLKELGAELGWQDPHAIFLALRSVLHALRDRLPPSEAADLAAQLPLLIKGVYFDGWRPGAPPAKVRSREEFFRLVMQPLARGFPEPDPERVTRAVFRILAEHVSQGEIRDVRLVLPAELADLWPTGAGTM
ncbi:MAG TPA: DUF2267 domain-containing protein [Gemmatimonadales bacterium]|jgi:uncharacterized protein (DUF2267 family)